MPLETPPLRSSAAMKGIAFMAAGTLFMGVNNAFLKLLTVGYPPGEILFFRGLFFFAPVVFFVWRGGGFKTLRIVSVKGHALRAVLVVASAFLFVNSVRYLPLADVVAIGFSGTLFVTMLAGPMLGEHVGLRCWAAIVVGFIGILLVTRPGSSVFQLAVLLPLGAALATALRDLYTRRLTMRESSNAIMVTSSAAILLSALCTMPFGWRPLMLADFGLMALSGVISGFGHYCMIETFRHAEAVLVSPFKYTAILWAVALGYIFWGDLPDAWVIAGSAVVIASGLYILHREVLHQSTENP